MAMVAYGRKIVVKLLIFFIFRLDFYGKQAIVYVMKRRYRQSCSLYAKKREWVQSSENETEVR
jgi:hypothetical protein